MSQYNYAQFAQFLRRFTKLAGEASPNEKGVPENLKRVDEFVRKVFEKDPKLEEAKDSRENTRTNDANTSYDDKISQNQETLRDLLSQKVSGEIKKKEFDKIMIDIDDNIIDIPMVIGDGIGDDDFVRLLQQANASSYAFDNRFNTRFGKLPQRKNKMM
jgi:hypothetical protein